MTGQVYGIGVGPGDPELVTLKAWRILRRAPVIAYPAPENGTSFARSIVASWLSPAQIELVISVPMVSERFPAQKVYADAAEAIAVHLTADRDVAMLCQGDPFFYGSFMYLFGRLSEHFQVTIVPGVSSLGACAAAARFPLAARNDALCILPATLSDNELKRRLRDCDAAAIIKLGRHFPRIHSLLARLGVATSAVYIEHATLEDAKVLNLATAKIQEAPYFSMILIHRRGEAWR